MKLREKISLENSLKWFAALCTLSLLTSTTPYTYVLYTPLLLLSMLPGAALLLYLFFVDRSVYRRPYFPFFFLFCVSYGITILLNRHSGFFSNCGQLVYTGFYFFLFFCVFSSLCTEAREATLRLLCRMVLVFSMVVAFFSLGMMLANYSAEIFLNGASIIIGFHQRNTSMQLTGITTGPSVLSTLSLLGIFSAWYLFRESRGARRRLGIFCGVVLLFTVGAANADSALIAMLAFAVLFVFCRNLSGTPSKRFAHRGVETVVQMLVCCLLVTGCFYGTQKLETAAVNGITQAVYQHELKEIEAQEPSTPGTSVPEDQPSDPTSPDSPEQPDLPAPPQEVTISRDVATSANGTRSAIWREGIKLFLAHPLGVTNNAISVKVFYGVPDYEYRNLHNGYLTLLAASGIVGFALVLAFGVLFFIRVMQALFRCTDTRRRLQLSVLIAACGAILAADLVNGCFVLWRNLQYIFLWLLLGEICAQITEPSPALTSPSGAE